jgi:hypothetical protein
VQELAEAHRIAADVNPDTPARVISARPTLEPAPLAELLP